MNLKLLKNCKNSLTNYNNQKINFNMKGICQTKIQKNIKIPMNIKTEKDIQMVR